MNSKAIMAIIVVAILLIAGGGVGLFFLLNNHNNDDSPVSVDAIKDDVVVGDYIEYHYKGHAIAEGSTSEDQFLSYLYQEGSGTLAGKETISYRGMPYECNVFVGKYDGKTTKYWITNSGVFLLMNRIIDNTGAIISKETLINSNFDITKSASEQKVNKGSFFQYEQYFSGIKRILNYQALDCKNSVVTLKATMDEDTTQENFKVKSVSSSGYLTLENGDSISKDYFIENLSYDLYMKKFNQKDITYISKTQETKTYDIGRRDVTVENFSVNQYGYTEYYTLEYGEKGVIYDIKESFVLDAEYKQEQTMEIRLIKTSMLKEYQPPTYDVDKIKDIVEVGDVISFSGVATESTTIKEMSLGDFVSGAYTDYTTPTGETKKIDFQGKTYQCAGYEYTEDEVTYTDWVIPDIGFILEKESTSLEYNKIVLVDTSMDVTIDQPSQMDKVEQDAYYYYDTKNTKGETITSVTTTLSKYTKDESMVEVTIDALLDMGVHTHKVTKIDGDNITFDDGDIETVQQLYSELDKEKWLDYQKSLGNTVRNVAVTEKRIDKTPFGDREVVTQTFEVIDKYDNKSTYKLTCGSNGVIYVMTAILNEEQAYIDYTMSYEKETTMIIPV